MRRKRATTAVLVTSFAAAAGEQTTRTGGLGSSHAADQRGGEESVSAEPLVYTADEEPWRDDPPRERTLEEARIRGGDFSWMEDYDISGEENAEHEHILAQEYDRIGGYEAPRFDSEFDPDAWALEDQDDLGGGIEKVGAPLEFGQPIARRLRRPGPAGSHDIAYDEEVEDQVRSLDRVIIHVFRLLTLFVLAETSSTSPSRTSRRWTLRRFWSMRRSPTANSPRITRRHRPTKSTAA